MAAYQAPGKNTGVGCHFLLQCMKVKIESEVAQLCPTLRDSMYCSLPGSSVHGILPGKNTGLGCHFLLQKIFPTQGLNPSLLHWQADFFFFFLPLSHHSASSTPFGSEFTQIVIEFPFFAVCVLTCGYPQPHLHLSNPIYQACLLDLWLFVMPI